jgi:hypothetical protein
MKAYRSLFNESNNYFKEKGDKLIFKLPPNESDLKALQVQYAYDKQGLPLHLAIDIFFNKSKTRLYRYSWVNDDIYLSIDRKPPVYSELNGNGTNNIYDYFSGIYVNQYLSNGVLGIPITDVIPNAIALKLKSIDFIT